MNCSKCVATQYCYRDGIKIINTVQSICDLMEKCSLCSHSKKSPGHCQLFLFDSVKNCVCLQCFLKPICSSFCDERITQFDKILMNDQQYGLKNF